MDVYYLGKNSLKNSAVGLQTSADSRDVFLSSGSDQSRATLIRASAASIKPLFIFWKWTMKLRQT